MARLLLAAGVVVTLRPAPFLPGVGPDPITQMVDLYNATATLHGLPVVQVLTAARRAKAVRRLEDCGGLLGWSVALKKLVESPFLLGKNERGWKASFDFLMQQSSFVKLMEGSYGPPPKPEPPAPEPIARFRDPPEVAARPAEKNDWERMTESERQAFEAMMRDGRQRIAKAR